MFDDEFIARLPHDDLNASLMICKQFDHNYSVNKNSPNYHTKCLDALAFAKNFVGSRGIDTVNLPSFEFTNNNSNYYIKVALNFFSQWKNRTITNSFEKCKAEL